MFVIIVFLLLISGLIAESWKQKFRRVGAYSIVLCIHDSMIYSIAKTDSTWLDAIFDKNIYGTIKNDHSVLTLFCYLIALLCGIIFSHFQSTGALFLVLSTLPYGVGLYQCHRESNLSQWKYKALLHHSEPKNQKGYVPSVKCPRDEGHEIKKH